MYETLLLVLVPVIVIAFVFMKMRTGGKNLISAEEAKSLIGTKGVQLVDVRTSAEFREGYIKGAKLLPLDEVGIKALDVLKNTDDTIIVYCRSGNRSRTAKTLLERKGFTDVRDLGGIIRWPYEIVR